MHSCALLYKQGYRVTSANALNNNGHAMAVVGYLTLKNDYTGASYNALTVCDGWDAELEILSYDVTPYRSHASVFCHGG